MTEALTVNTDATGVLSSPDGVRVSRSGSSRLVLERLPRRVPLFIPREQAYYWTREWQEDEARALEELARGEGVLFHDPTEAARWLLSPEDDEPHTD